MNFVMGLAMWGWDAVRTVWNAATWRDVLVLLILVGLWRVGRNVRRVLVRLRELGDKVEDMDTATQLYVRRRDLDEKVDRIERILGVN
jgi:hypothetical protein